MESEPPPPPPPHPDSTKASASADKARPIEIAVERMGRINLAAENCCRAAAAELNLTRFVETNGHYLDYRYP